jgi:hypothetical protein
MRLARAPEPAAAGCPDPDAVGAECLARLRTVGWLAGLGLALLAIAAPGMAGDHRAALLPGVPAALLLATHALGRPLYARRIAGIATTSVGGFLVMATLPALTAMEELAGPRARAVGLQLACLALGAVILMSAWPAWRAFHSRAGQALLTRRAFEEL